MQTLYKRTLSPTYHTRFWQQGYLLFPNYFSNSEAEKIKDWSNELETWPEEKGKWMIYYEKDSQQMKKRSRIENFINYHPEMNNFIQSRVTSTLADIYQKPMTLFKDKMNWKKAYGKGFKAHQDQPAWSDFPPPRFVSVALFGDKTSENNGCLEFVPKKHLNGLYDYDLTNLGELTPEVEKDLDWEYIETSPRDLLIFDSFAPHRSKANQTNMERRIFYFTYNPMEDGDFHQKYIDKKRIEFPPDIEREKGKNYKVTCSRYNLANPIE